jgi:hypothetical protein
MWRVADVPRGREEERDEAEEEKAARTTSAYFRQAHPHPQQQSQQQRGAPPPAEGRKKRAGGGGDVDPVTLGRAEEAIARAQALEAARLEEAAALQVATGKKRSGCVSSVFALLRCFMSCMNVLKTDLLCASPKHTGRRTRRP